MTKKAKSAREVAEEFGGVHRIPKPVAKDLNDTFASGTLGFFADAWKKRVEQEIATQKLNSTDFNVLEFFELFERFEVARKSLQDKRGNPKLRENLEGAFKDLRGAAEKLQIRTDISRSDEL